jgi:5-carboxymethyl-2-hydroxymuconate isomerase
VSQIKIYGLKDNLDNIKQKLSETIHSTIVEILSFPKDKKYHRFISLDKEDMIFSDDKSHQYIIIEIMMIEGRETETKKNLIKSLFKNINKDLDISVNDIEICIIESKASNWGFRGMTGDEILLNYKVGV